MRTLTGHLGNAIGPALFVLAAIVVVLLPRFMGEFRLIQFTLVAIFAIALLGLNILTGYSGQISLGHGAFVGIGAYVAALLSLGRPNLELLQLDPPDWLPIGDGMTPLYTIPIAAVVTGIFGVLVGIPALRLGGVSLALATLAVAVSFPIVMKRFDEVTGGGGGTQPQSAGDAVRLGHLHPPLALLRGLGRGGDPLPRSVALDPRPRRARLAGDPRR